APRPTARADPGLGLHESGRARCESGCRPDHRAPRRSRPRGHMPRGHVARAPIRHGRDALGERGVLFAKPIPAEGRLRGTEDDPGALHMWIIYRGIVAGRASGMALVSSRYFYLVVEID